VPAAQYSTLPVLLYLGMCLLHRMRKQKRKSNRIPARDTNSGPPKHEGNVLMSLARFTCREEGLAVHLKLLSQKLREPYKATVTTAVARSKYPPNKSRVGRILSRLLQKLRTRQYSFLRHYHNAHCLAESPSLLWEAL
jgi:hypothetical protein